MIKCRLNGKYDLILPTHRAKAWKEWGGYWEVERIDSMVNNVKEGDIVFDIGAEEGDISALLAQKVGGENMVLFEPGPQVWPNMHAIWCANNLETPRGCYVGFASDVTEEFPQALDYSREMRDGWPVSAYGDVIDDHGFRHVMDWTDKTSQITLDDWCERSGVYPDMITMDVEGSELKVLLGAEKILREREPLVYVSIHPDLINVMYNMEYQRIFHFMKGLGYKEEYLATDHEQHFLFRSL